ncbi:MAG TPA: amidohydrolase [Candidatus Acidoferrum sp.]|nr:amidohydrolase [Candidatus Acidoferrum sp.]
MNFRRLGYLGAFLALTGLSVAHGSVSTSKDSKLPADLVLTHGNIFTGVKGAPRATGVAVSDGVIVAVISSDDALKALIGPKTRVIDLQGQFVMPGWNDAHVHLASAGFAKMEVDLTGTRSIAELQQRVRERLGQYKQGQWVLGEGWDHTLWPEKQFPTRQDLDAISTEHPIYLERVDGHVAVVNSLALKIAGITAATPDPPGGRIMRDPKTGEPTGMLEEDAGLNLVYEHVPPYSDEQRRRAFELALDEAASYGVTSVQDNSVQTTKLGDNYGWENFLALEAMKREGKLKVRVTEWLPFTASLGELEKMRKESGGGASAGNPGDPLLKTGNLKGFLDGSLGSRTAAMLAPYSDAPDTSGILLLDPEKVKQMAIERDRAGFQIAFHAIGDRANRVGLDAFAAVKAANPPRDRRDRIEHAQVVAPGDFARFASLDLIASMQPSHLLDDERWAEDRLGPERVKGAYAWHTMLAEGVHLAFGTDFPVESINPLRGLYACVTRKLPDGGGPADGWQPQEKLTAFDCIHEYTVGSAYAQFEEKRKGLLKAGMLADMVVYPDDVTKLAPMSLLTEEVSLTITGGRVVYEKK